MKIGFDAKRLFHNFSGLGNYSRTLVRNLAQFHPQNSYYLYTTRLGQTAETSEFLDETRFSLRLPGSFKPFWRRKGVSKDIRKDEIDVFHGLSHQIPIGLKKHSVRTVVTIHDLIHKIFPETYHYLDRRIYDHRLNHAVKNADHIIAISEQTKKDIIEHYPLAASKISVIYQACDPIFYSDETTSLDTLELPGSYLLYVGSLSPRKNLLNLIRAYAKVADRPELVLVGRGHSKYKSLLIKEGRKLGISRGLHFFENIHTTTHLKSIYSRSLGLLYPSWYEGFGIPVLEAALCQIPIMTSNISSLPEAGGPATIYIDPFDIDSIASGIEKTLTSNPEKLQQTYLYARDTFNPEKCTSAVTSVYESLL